MRLVFEGRERGCRTLERLLRDASTRVRDFELVALAVPRVPGGVRRHLDDACATAWVIAAADGALEEMGAMLASRGLPYRTRVEAGTLARATRASLQDDAVDVCVVATGWPRWRIAWLLQGRDTCAWGTRLVVA